MSYEMKYKPGDKVMIRSDLQEDVDYAEENSGNGLNIASDMLEYAGQVVTIAHNRQFYYGVEEDDHEWNWSIGMFDPSYGEFDSTEVDTSGLSPMFDDLFK